VSSAAHARACARGDAAAVLEAKRLMAAGRIKAYIIKVLDGAPPLTAAEQAELAAVLRGEVQS
jgi:hypothetical protein